MTSTEIVRSYKEAKNKPQQIRILADLNACDMETIREVLRQGGIPADELFPRMRHRSNTAVTAQEAQTAPKISQTIKIPTVAREACLRRLQEITATVMELTGEKEELERFLEGKE